jgi:cysteine desulfurase
MIYLDYQATTPLDPAVRDAMLPWLGDRVGNPHAASRAGRAAAAAIEIARDQVSAALGITGGQLIFTSGATEAVNWAMAGGVAAVASRRAIVTVATEHSCVLETARHLERQGMELRVLPVDRDGLLDLDNAATAIDRDVALVAVMAVNNEIGVIQPLDAIARLAHSVGALFLCDAVQGFGRVPLPAEADMIALSAHKIHGPGGIGALWLRDDLALPPLLHGGGQQHGLRPGTLPTALCVGFGAAARQADLHRDRDAAHVAALSASALAALGPAWQLNGSATRRYRGNLNLRQDGVDAARLISELRDVAFSAGSACASGSGRPSHVLQAIGLATREARSSIRLGFGRFTTAAEIEEAAAAIARAAQRQLEWAA